MPRRPILIAAVLFSLLLVAYRLTLGVDFIDESYYAAMALRFLQGDRPFVDELFVNQTGILPLLPFVKPYVALFGNEGLILYLRALYFLFSLGLASAIYFSLRTFASAEASASAALLGVVFIPLNIPALSYNTLGGGGFALALFLAWAYLQRGTPWLAGAAMAALALCELTYPPLVLPGLLFLALFWRRSPTRRKGLLKAYLVAHLILFLACLPLLQQAGMKLIDAYIYTAHAHHHGGGLGKGKIILEFIVKSMFTPAGLLGYATLILAALTGRRLWLALFPFCLAYNFHTWGFPSVWIFIQLSVAGPVFYLLGRREGADTELLKLVWLPSFVAGLLTAWMSSSSPANLIIGFWAAGIVSLFYLARIPRNGGAAATMVAVFLAFLYVGKVFYVDGAFGRLTERVPTGPFRGLATTPEKREYLRAITDDIHRLEDPEGKIVFYEFPAGYLLTSMRIGVNSAWMRTESLGKLFYVRHYVARASDHDLVFKINIIDHGYPSWLNYSAEDPFIQLLQARFDRVLQRPNYEAFRPKGLLHPQPMTPATSDTHVSPGAAGSVASISTFKQR